MTPDAGAGGPAVEAWPVLLWAWLGLGVTVGLLGALTAAAIAGRRRRRR